MAEKSYVTDPVTKEVKEYEAKKPDKPASMADRAKYDPALQNSGMSQAQVQASGGLGAYAKAHQAKSDAETRKKKQDAIK